LIAPRLGPLIEGVPRRRVENVWFGGCEPGGRECAFAREQLGGSIVVHEIGCASQHGELDLRAALAAEHRDAIFTWPPHLDPCRRRIDAIANLPARPDDVQAGAALEQPDDFVRLEIDDRVGVHVEGAAVRIEDFHATRARAQAIAGEQRHGGRGTVGLAVALEDGGALDERHVCGSLPRGVLCERGCAGQQQHRHEPEGARKCHDGAQAGHRNLRERRSRLSRRFRR
jgi:hypothetical protein